MKVALDTRAIIYLNDFRMFEEIFTVIEVIDEVKDRISSLKLSGVKANVIEPGKSAVDEIKKIAKTTGDLEKLSKTDIKILALAKELDLIVVSDDYNVQNVAQKMGMGYLSLFNEKITKAIKWGMFCRNCKKFFEDAGNCPKCGSRLARKPATEELIRNKN
jgi:endoribonuclease Nob1